MNWGSVGVGEMLEGWTQGPTDNIPVKTDDALGMMVASPARFVRQCLPNIISWPSIMRQNILFVTPT